MFDPKYFVYNIYIHIYINGQADKQKKCLHALCAHRVAFIVEGCIFNVRYTPFFVVFTCARFLRSCVWLYETQEKHRGNLIVLLYLQQRTFHMTVARLKLAFTLLNIPCRSCFVPRLVSSYTFHMTVARLKLAFTLLNIPCRSCFVPRLVSSYNYHNNTNFFKFTFKCILLLPVCFLLLMQPFSNYGILKLKLKYYKCTFSNLLV